MKSVRQVTAFCAIAALAEVLFYAAIAPLLPSLDRAFGLGHAQGRSWLIENHKFCVAQYRTGNCHCLALAT
jgi:hypothetical protein